MEDRMKKRKLRGLVKAGGLALLLGMLPLPGGDSDPLDKPQVSQVQIFQQAVRGLAWMGK